MIVNVNSSSLSGVDGLGFSLKPPKVVRNLVKKVAAQVGIKATVPTPAGPIVVDSRDPDTLRRVADAARAAISRTTFSVGPNTPADPSPTADVRDFVENSIPGGWLTLGGGAIALFFLVRAMSTKGKGR